LKSRSSYQSV